MTHLLPFFAYPVAQDMTWLGLLVLMAIIIFYPLYEKLKAAHRDMLYRKKQRRINKEVLKLIKMQRER